MLSSLVYAGKTKFHGDTKRVKNDMCEQLAPSFKNVGGLNIWIYVYFIVTEPMYNWTYDSYTVQ